jgi:L-ascorbate metabolism protein UlaG (beta-lactamase superfamily)
MSPREAAAACRLLKPKKVIPMHFGTFPPLTGRPDELRKALAPTNAQMVWLEPGKPVEW